MKFAFSTNAYTNGKWKLTQAIERIAKAGYDGVEILADKPLLWLPKAKAINFSKVTRCLQKNKLEVSNVNAFTCSGFYGDRKAPPGQQFGPSWADEDPAYREYRIEYTKKVIDFTADIGAKNISVGAGHPVKGVPQKEQWERVLDGLEKVVEYAERRGVRINLEYEPLLIVDSVDKAKKMLEEIPSRYFGLNFDIGHSYVCGEDVVKAVEKVFSRINNFHVEDIPHDSKGKPRHYHVVPGKGKMPLNQIFKAIELMGYNGFYTVELYTMSDKPVQATDESIKWLRKMEAEVAKEVEKERPKPKPAPAPVIEVAAGKKEDPKAAANADKKAKAKEEKPKAEKKAAAPKKAEAKPEAREKQKAAPKPKEKEKAAAKAKKTAPPKAEKKLEEKAAAKAKPKGPEKPKKAEAKSKAKPAAKKASTAEKAKPKAEAKPKPKEDAKKAAKAPAAKSAKKTAAPDKSAKKTTSPVNSSKKTKTGKK